MIIKLITKLNRNTYCLLTKGSSAFRPSPMVWGAERESSQSRLLLWRLNMRKTLGQLRQGLSHPKHDLVGGAITIWLVIIPITLSGWWFQPLLKNMSSSIGLMKFQIWWGNIQHVPNHQPVIATCCAQNGHFATGQHVNPSYCLPCRSRSNHIP